MFKKEVYIKRREQLHRKMSGGIAFFTGNNESPMNCSANTFHFRQDSTFLYLFGLDLPGLVAVSNFETGEDIIFGNDVDIEDIIWMGPQKPLREKASESGITITKPFSDLIDYIQTAISKGIKIHFTPPYRADNQLLISELTGIHPQMQKKYASEELIKSIVSLREIKDEYEIAEIEDATTIGYDMHLAAIKMAKPGIYESELTGIIEGIAASRGGHYSFPVILTQNGETLHNHYHGNKLEAGKLLLTDAGGENGMHYASDFTRTVPVSGKFSQLQKEIYQIVLDTNNKATTLMKPGIPYRTIHLEAAKVIATGLKNLGLMKGNVDDAVAAGAHAMFLPHGLGHAMGLDVHDMEDLGEDYVGYNDEIVRSTQFGLAYLRMGKELKDGFVITNEPGIYFIPALIDKWQNEKINSEFINFDKINKHYRSFGGIRLEDDILITSTGSRILGKRIPITIEEIENTMNS